MQDYGDTTSPTTYSMKRAPLSGARSTVDQQQLNALLSRFKTTSIPTAKQTTTQQTVRIDEIIQKSSKAEKPPHMQKKSE